MSAVARVMVGSATQLSTFAQAKQYIINTKVILSTAYPTHLPTTVYYCTPLYQPQSDPPITLRLCPCLVGLACTCN